jgi:hypothetical protein
MMKGVSYHESDRNATDRAAGIHRRCRRRFGRVGGVPAGIAATVGWIASRFVPDGGSESEV